jgi:hypothetical protein
LKPVISSGADEIVSPFASTIPLNSKYLVSGDLRRKRKMPGLFTFDATAQIYPPSRIPPFHGFADILYCDHSIRLSLSTLFSMKSSAWDINGINPNESSRSQCNILIEELEARLDHPPIQRGPVEIQEVRLHIGPSATASRMVTAHHQVPSLTNISVSGSSNYRERGITLGTGYPTFASLGAVAKWGETLERPPTSIGLDFKGVQVGIENGNQFYWRYPVSKSQEYMKKSATFPTIVGRLFTPQLLCQRLCV